MTERKQDVTTEKIKTFQEFKQLITDNEAQYGWWKTVLGDMQESLDKYNREEGTDAKDYIFGKWETLYRIVGERGVNVGILDYEYIRSPFHHSIIIAEVEIFPLFRDLTFEKEVVDHLFEKYKKVRKIWIDIDMKSEGENKEKIRKDFMKLGFRQTRCENVYKLSKKEWSA